MAQEREGSLSSGHSEPCRGLNEPEWLCREWTGPLWGCVVGILAPCQVPRFCAWLCCSPSLPGSQVWPCDCRQSCHTRLRRGCGRCIEPCSPPTPQTRGHPCCHHWSWQGFQKGLHLHLSPGLSKCLACGRESASHWIERRTTEKYGWRWWFDDEIVLKLKTFGGKAVLSGTRSWLESSGFWLDGFCVALGKSLSLLTRGVDELVPKGLHF